MIFEEDGGGIMEWGSIFVSLLYETHCQLQGFSAPWIPSKFIGSLSCFSNSAIMVRKQLSLACIVQHGQR